MKRPILTCAAALLLTLGAYACIEPPPKIAAVPASGFALRLHVFGASAVEAQRTFAAVKQNNPSFALVDEGGDGEVLVGLENDSPHCVAPTAMCSYRVSYRITDNDGVVLAAKTTTVDATSDSCSDLCAQALNHVAVKIVEIAVSELHGEGAEAPADAPVDSGSIAKARPDGGLLAAGGAKKGKTDGTRNVEPAICSAGHGPRLPSEEAEMRAAQVEVLKRLGTLDQGEYDCLRKAYLDRL
jgi:hypothetical protein